MHYTYDTPPGDPTASRIFFKFTNQRQLEFVSQRNRLSPRGRGGSLFFFPAEAGKGFRFRNFKNFYFSKPANDGVYLKIPNMPIDSAV